MSNANNDQRNRLIAYLDQEDARIMQQWSETDEQTRLDLLDWLAEGQTAETVRDASIEWVQFATRCALAYLQKEIALKEPR